MDDEENDELPLPKGVKISELEAAALQNIYNGYDGLIEPNLHRLTYEVLGAAINDYFAPNAEITLALQESASWFAANKSYLVARVLAKNLTDENGKKRSFAEFKKATAPLTAKYNQQWLKTEYNTAVRASRIAANFEQYERDADLYANLEYVRSRAATPREAHLVFVGIRRPINDPFWITHTPPLDWLCLCGIRQSDKDVTPLSGTLPKPAAGLGHNVYRTRELFGSSHPYFRRVPKAKREEIKKWVKEQANG